MHQCRDVLADCLLTTTFLQWHDYFLFLAVLAAARKSAAEGAPFEPGLRIRSSEPALIRACLARIAS